MNTCTSCGKIKLGNSVMQGCACQNLMQAPPAAQPAPVQEPVAWTLLLVGRHNGIIGKAGEKFLGHPEHYDRIDVYTAPPAPQRTWVGLTNEEMSFLFPHGKSAWVQETVKIIETKLRSKNENL